MGNEKKLNVFVLYGGKSAEHEVSIKTAFNVLNRIDRNMYDVYAIYVSRQGIWHSCIKVESALDDIGTLNLSEHDGSIAGSIAQFLNAHLSNIGSCVVFPVIHGTHGEDGTLQGMLEMLNVPYVGNGVAASAVGMDKVMMKSMFASAGIGQAEYAAYTKSEWNSSASRIVESIGRKPGYPCYVKPAKLGSSIGMSRCINKQQLIAAVELAFKYDWKIIVEKEVIGREVQLAVLGNDDPECSVGGEFVRDISFFDYDNKYTNDGLVQRIPAAVSAGVEERLQKIALEAFRLLEGAGLMRVDFFITDRDEIYLNEVNTMPGFTAISMFPALWRQTNGISYGELLDKLIELALEKHRHKQSVRYGREEA